MKRLLFSGAIAAAGLMVMASTAQATTLTCTGANRELTVYNVMAGCHFGNSDNPNAADVATVLGGTWTNEGVLSNSSGHNDLLTVNTTGWQSADADGTFLIDSAFWSTYGRGALSFHVGEGNGDPDWWIFELTPGFTGIGTFDLHKLSLGGGGLSNINLWGSGDPQLQQLCDTSAPCVPNPEPASLVLMGTGLVGFAAMLRRRSARKA